MGKYIKIFGLLFLTGCIQSTASLIGPAYTIGSSGNIYQAGLSYGLNETLQRTTGKSTIDHAKLLLENTKNYHQQGKNKLKNYAIAGINAEIVDLKILYVELNSTIYYNPAQVASPSNLRIRL